jgi:hypothetical protein
MRRSAPSLSRGAEPANPSPAIMCAFLHITADRRLSTRPNLCAACTQWLVGIEITPARPSVSPKNVQISHTWKMYGHAVHISFAMASVDNALILREYRAHRFSKPWLFRDISPNASGITEVRNGTKQNCYRCSRGIGMFRKQPLVKFLKTVKNKD